MLTQPNESLKAVTARYRRHLLAGVGLGVLVMLALAVIGNADGVARGLAAVRLSHVAAACGLSLVNYVFRFAKWHYLLRCLGLAVPAATSFATFMSGLSMSVTPGKLGELLKSVMLKDSCGIPIATSAPVVVAERATDALGLMLLAAAGSLSLPYGEGIIGGFAAVSLVAMWLVRRRSLVSALLLRLSAMPRVGKHVPTAISFYDSAYELSAPFRVLLTSVMSAGSWAMEGLAFFIILKGLGLDLAFLDAVFIFSFSSLVGAISMLPGGLGAADGSLVGLLVVEGCGRGPATSATLLIRLCTLWLAVAVGLVFLAVRARSLRPHQPQPLAYM